MTSSGKVVMGIDNSTMGTAFCMMKDGVPLKWGEVKFKGANTFERIAYARKVMQIILPYFSEVNVIGIEKTAKVNSIATAIYLAMAAGVIISCFSDKCKVVEIPALSWQNATSKPHLSKAEKNALKIEYPGKSSSWYRNKARLISKQNTLNWVEETYGIKLDNDNIGDSFGLATFLSEKGI